MTSSIDLTVDYIINKYSNVAEFYRLDIDNLNNYNISVNNTGWSISNIKWGHLLYMTDVTSIYYRKPRFPNLAGIEPAYRDMINNDILALINGIIDSFKGKVLTKPYILRKTENKIMQLIYAAQNNIMIPVSFIGNDSDAVGKFSSIETIIKPISIGKIYDKDRCEIYQTSYFYDYEEDISLTPIYLQEYVKKTYEVRLTIINEKVFPVKIISKNKLDWRKGYADNEYSIIDIPDLILKQTTKMLNDFELKFGAIDYIVNENNEWIFLEINPNGQWQWLEKELNLNISNEIINYLIT